jgi:carboxyl-terminal processing protease
MIWFIDQKLATSVATPENQKLSEQLAIFEFVWKKVNERYLYPDFNSVDWNSVHVEYRKMIEDGLSYQAFYEKMKVMIDLLGDGHSYFAPPFWDNKGVNPGNGNPGIMEEIVSGQQPTVIIAINKDSPAERAGLKPRDSILAVNGESPVAVDDMLKSLYGPIGTQMTLTVQTPGQEPRLVKLIRDITNQVPVISYQVLTTLSDKHIGYIDLTTFAHPSISDQVGQALKEMSTQTSLNGLILDVRVNVGGYNDELIKTLSYFTHGTLGYLVSRYEQRPFEIDTLNDVKGSSKLPLVILIGPDTTSAAEIFAGVLWDTGRAYLIGETTAGELGILTGNKSESGWRFAILTEIIRPLNHPDVDWIKTGVIPDLTVVAPWYMYSVENDPAIQEALKYLDQR